MKPPRLGMDDTVGIVSTSSPVAASDLKQLVAYFHDRAYRVKVADHLLDADGYLAGSAEHRAQGIMSMFSHPEVGLVLPAVGGTGASQLVARLDYGAIRRHPKIFAGFSNPTVLNNALWARADLPSLHGVTGYDLFRVPIDPKTESAVWRMVTGSIAGQRITGSGWRVLRGGPIRVSGPVIGGNLEAFRTLVGTDYMPSPRGAVLLLEAMTATFEQVDLALTHLRLAGVFDQIAALLIGAPADWTREGAPDSDVDALVLRCVGGKFPVVVNVPFGHQREKILFPIGCRVAVDLSSTVPCLAYLEDLVESTKG